METNDWSLVKSDRTVLCSRCRAAYDQRDFGPPVRVSAAMTVSGRLYGVYRLELLRFCKVALHNSAIFMVKLALLRSKFARFFSIRSSRPAILSSSSRIRAGMFSGRWRTASVSFFTAYSLADIIPFGDPVLWATILRRPLSDFGSG